MPCAKCFGEIDDISHFSTTGAVYELCAECAEKVAEWIEDESEL